MKRNFLTYILLCILLLGSAACQDDPLYNGGEIGEGESLVSATVKFKPLTPALNGNTRTAGNVIKNINNLCVLLYNEKGELLKTYPLTEGTDEGQYQLEDKDRPDNNPDSNLPPAEAQTPHADFKLKIPYGRYQIYAVANMEDLLTNEEYSEAIKTANGLKSISLQWDKDKVANNNQMFGYFTVTGSVQNDEVAVINRASTKLHAWIRRAASKVTIAYDGSDLHENVFIYLKSVTIKDIPTECYLGKKSTINMNPKDDIEDYGDLMTEGESITYAEGTNYDEHWPARVTKGKPYYYYIDNAQKGASVLKAEYDSKRAEYAKLAHGETNEALFFYENMQGEGKDKRQDADGDKELDAPGLPDDETYINKDDKPYGTYIEVKAYYISNADGRVGSGDIIYRFMLGKDVYKDYNAERNHHYKLTLKFNKYANDVDWHIEYEEKKPGIEVPNPYYISYLYNRTMDLPMKINTGGGKLVSLEANILTNNWGPRDAYTGNPDQLDYAYWYDYDVTSRKDYTGQNKENPNQPWNGFLSLRKTKYKILTNVQSESNDKATFYVTDNKQYYDDHKIGTRTYLENSQEIGNNDDNGKFRIEPNEAEQTINVAIPFYTRAKQMIITTGYTGNNPYVAYQRRATVEIKAILEMPGERENEILVDTVEILQVRRLVNPKGIYRKHNNNSSFHVKLLKLPRENDTQFVEFTSEGPWKAEIVEGSTSGFVNLNGSTLVEGNTGTPIDFMVNFEGNCSENQNRYAIIRVHYHNYTCQHLIFVRQGDAPDALLEGGTRWHAHNLVTASSETESPLDEGSLFKLGNMAHPIAASNQVNQRVPWINVKPGDFPDYQEAEKDKFPILKIVGQEEEMNWGDIPTINSSQNNANCQIQPNQSMWNLEYNRGHNDGTKYVGKFALSGARIAEFNDFYALFDSDEIEQGYGVLYGNEATETATDIQQAYRYRAGIDTDGYGMRGCFVYNKNTCKNLFFPIGASGYGHRKRADLHEGSSWDYHSFGILRYSSDRYTTYPENGKLSGEKLSLKPLFYDLYMRPGAIYWLDKEATMEDGTTIGWDINYFTFDFNHISRGKLSLNVYNNDACFIRCVEDENTTTR